MTVYQASISMQTLLRNIYPAREAATITNLVMEKITGLRKVDRIIDPHHELTEGGNRLWHQYMDALERREPIQYVIGEAWFMGMRFFVDRRVLIPRPETEELVQWVVADHLSWHPTSVLDMGTGSGCIAIALQKKIPEAVVTGADVSEDALDVAKANAGILGSPAAFLKVDVLDSRQWSALPQYDVIVSNPPYIPATDRGGMEAHVADHEPALALFVPDEDPLIFYRAIAQLGKTKLAGRGSIYVESHEDRATDAAAVFGNLGYSTIVKKDMQGKDRMIRAKLA